MGNLLHSPRTPLLLCTHCATWLLCSPGPILAILHPLPPLAFSMLMCVQVIPTPLTRLYWWRVCLDEAQMVETSTAKAAEMAGKLAARHRWCITGTPLSRGLEDLFGLLYFLRAAPLHNKFWWARVCQRPYEAGSQAGVVDFCLGCLCSGVHSQLSSGSGGVSHYKASTCCRGHGHFTWQRET